jgi:prepilin-type N-terminal cleavage/methylation domain-containing protein
MVSPNPRRGAVNSAEVIVLSKRLALSNHALPSFQQNPDEAGTPPSDSTGQRGILLAAKRRTPCHMSRKANLNDIGFTLVELMIVVAVIALLAAIAVPSFLRARKRSQATTVKNDLRLIDAAIAQYAIETSKKEGDDVYVDDWLDYIKDDSRLQNTAQDILGNDYNDQAVDDLPVVPAQTWDALSDVADTSFWLPYQRETTPRGKHKNRSHGHHH